CPGSGGTHQLTRVPESSLLVQYPWASIYRDARVVTMARWWPQSRSGDVALLVPGTVGVAGAGALAAYSPTLGAGVAGLTLLACLGWGELFFLLGLAAQANRYRLHVAGFTVQPAHVILIPFALRVLLLTRQRFRWRGQEWVIVAFLLLQFGTSYFNSVSK